jgi:hypothetical protein
MKSIKMVGLCLVAVFAMSAFAAASANAELGSLEYITCFKVSKANKGKGKFNEKLCATASKGGAKEGEYEGGGSWELLKKKTFTGKNGVSTLDSYIPSNEATPWTGGTVVGKVVCKKAKSAGQITGRMTSTVVVTFETCTTEGKKCTSAGAPKVGDIVTNQLLSTIVMTEGKTAALVKGNNEAGESAAFACEGLEVETFGSLNGINTGNTEKYSATSTQTFTVNAEGGQEHPFTEEAPETPDFLVSHITPPGILLPSGENTTSTLKGEAVEID